MKRIIYLSLLLAVFKIIIACSSKPALVEQEIIEDGKPPQGFVMEELDWLIPEKSGFRYAIPDGMREHPAEAKKYKFDNLIIDEGTTPINTGKMIAIRKTEKKPQMNLSTFVENDQSLLKESVKLYYNGEWKPEALIKKQIDFQAIQFFYDMNKQRFYQRSVYLEHDNNIYVISLSSRDKDTVTDGKINNFWGTIEVD